MKIWVLYGSLDWNEFSEVHLTEAAAKASMREHFEIDPDVEEDQLDLAVSEAFENGKWVAFSIDAHEIAVEDDAGT